MVAEGGNDRVVVRLSVTAADLKAFSSYVATGPEMAIFHRNRRLYMAMCFVGGASFAFTDLYWMLPAITVPIAVVSVLLRRSSADARFEMIRPGFEGDLTADANGLTLVRPGVMSHVYWSALQELVVTDTVLIARTNALGGYVIPKRCLHDAGDVDRLIRWRVAAKAGIDRPPPPPPYRPSTDSPAFS